MRISDWSSDVCSSDLRVITIRLVDPASSRGLMNSEFSAGATSHDTVSPSATCSTRSPAEKTICVADRNTPTMRYTWPSLRSEEHTSELQSLMRISYAVFCLKKKKINNED